MVKFLVLCVLSQTLIYCSKRLESCFTSVLGALGSNNLSFRTILHFKWDIQVVSFLEGFLVDGKNRKFIIIFIQKGLKL